MTPEERRQALDAYAALDARLAEQTAHPLNAFRPPEPGPDGDTRALLADRQRIQDAQMAMAQAEVTGPGELDSWDREQYYVRQFAHTTGRMPDVRELRGPAVADCAGCERMNGSGPCDDHARRRGEPIPYPPESTWPSRQLGHYPGAIHLPPYNIYKSVG